MDFTNTINEIRRKVDIVDVISSYLPLTEKGKNHFGICPFHDDTNPSMSVSRDKQIFKCFSCSFLINSLDDDINGTRNNNTYKMGMTKMYKIVWRKNKGYIDYNGKKLLDNKFPFLSYFTASKHAIPKP